MDEAPMFIVQKRKFGEVEKYCVVTNAAHLLPDQQAVIVTGPAEFEVDMIAVKLNEALSEGIAEVLFNCANCQGEVV